jgi:inosine-uridine nucleoside N-ribohydrolase
MFNMIFDTDMGNDIDDAFAQLMAANAHAKGEINLALTVSSNPNPSSIVMIEAINRHYGAVSPLAIHRGALRFSNDTNGFSFSSAVKAGVVPDSLSPMDAVPALRKTLASLPDASVRVVATGFATNLAGLLASKGDAIPMDGVELVRRKVEFLSVMACDFDAIEKHGEFNVIGDIPAMKSVLEKWPTPIFVSPFKTGLSVTVDWPRLDRQLRNSNPVKNGYRIFFKDLPGARPSWDQTSMLFALEPDAGHFALTEPGRVEIKDSGESIFHAGAEGNCRLLRFDSSRTPEMVNETLHSRFYQEP